MKRFLLLVVVAMCLQGGILQADGGENADPTLLDHPELNSTMTPEMWFYLQEMKQRNDPSTLVHRNAERRAQERRTRISAMRWYGMSNQRPRASIGPFHGTYSPTWTNGHTDPNVWSVGGYGSILVSPRAHSMHR